MINEAARLMVIRRFDMQSPADVCQRPRGFAEILRGTQLCGAFGVSRPPIRGSSTRARDGANLARPVRGVPWSSSPVLGTVVRHELRTQARFA
jgi:hypothetical protein